MLRASIPVLHVSTAAGAEAFYCDGLGFTRRFAFRIDPARPDPCYMGVERDGVWLHLSSFPGDGVAGGVAYVVTDNVDAEHAALVSRGVAIDTGPVDQTWGNREVYVRDPDGNSVRFVQERG